jgi:sulfatase maturation enzyme AslB (radical SAM superfamily)
MKLRLVEKVIRNAAIGVEIFFNRRLGRQFIPLDLGAFSIEPSSVCNLKCRFCAYEKKTSPRVSMSNEMFRDAIEQAIGMGFTRFHLTPTTGEVFMDKHLFDKLIFLDANPKVCGYHFFTNLTIPSREQLMQLQQLKKLERLTISVYGHDEKSFLAITRTNAKIYQRLVTNLQTVLLHVGRWHFPISIGFRSTFDVPARDESELMNLLTGFRKAGVGVHSSHGIYNNWGGHISQSDVPDLNLYIIPTKGPRKSGACVKLFDAVQIMATGIVNACCCRDVDATLRIGDLREKPLAEIISSTNPEYIRIIEEQQEGKFQPVCKSCDYYRSIYHQPTNYRRDLIPVQSLRQFLNSLSLGGERKRK